jgi:hypothetical protein
VRTLRAVQLPALVEALDSKNATEGVLALQERRPPVWSDR